MKKLLLITGTSLCFSFATAHADVIYTDNFNRTSTSLEGTYPTTDNAPGDPAWSETDGTTSANGTPSPISTNGSAALFSNAENSSSAILPITLAANTDYYAQVTLALTSGSTGYWGAAGFTDTATPGNSFLNDSAALWSLQSDTGKSESFSPSGQTTATDAGSVSGPDTLTFVIDTGAAGSGATFSITDSQDLVDYTGTLSASDVASIAGFAIGDYGNNNPSISGKFSDLQIGTGPVPTPEPSPAALFLLGSFGLVALLRFRKRTA